MVSTSSLSTCPRVNFNLKITVAEFFLKNLFYCNQNLLAFKREIDLIFRPGILKSNVIKKLRKTWEKGGGQKKVNKKRFSSKRFCLDK